MILVHYDKDMFEENNDIPWKDNGVYLITGGIGGLGLIFAKEIVHKVKHSFLILIGRSKIDEIRQTKLKQLEILGSKVEYKQVDVTKKEEVVKIIQFIKEEYGHLDGIIHGAGSVHDNYIVNKSTDELKSVMAPKVYGVVNLDEASQGLPLDFFVLFSSGTGSFGNPGQADYAAANSFMDSYARYRNTLVAAGQRHGHTLSINWPLWRDGGMHVNAETEKMMQSRGLNVMSARSGIQAFYQGFGFKKDQVIVMEGKPDKLKQKVLGREIPDTSQLEKEDRDILYTTSEIDANSLLEKVQEKLVKLTSQFLKNKNIDLDTELNEYGFDSITFTQFANVLNQEYKLDLGPTIFFEHSTLRGLAKFLNSKYQGKFSELFALKTKSSKVEQPQKNQQEEKTKSIKHSLSRKHSGSTKSNFSVKTEPAGIEPIAIVGMSGVFPKAENLDEFWENLKCGEDCISEIPENRWDWRAYYGDPLKEDNKTNIKWGGFINGIDEFDPLFFGISPKEAEIMDPQQRLLMTQVWKTIEDAGYSAQSLSGTKTAIFVGTAGSGYSNLVVRAGIPIEGNSSTGMVASVGPNRMSYFLNIHGPSEPIETACSSSLIAIHRAVEAIRNESCEMAIVGGVNTIVTPEAHISFNKAGMLAVDGRCKTFSSQANGYSRGEGVGMLFLKKLKDAEQAGDHIYGVIRGTAENHGGRANSLTAPNPKAQAELLKTAYRNAGFDPRTITYIEAHGTGTKLGDPIEIEGLKAAFKELYKETGDSEVLNRHCGVGSVKTNIGHLELAAGVAGVIKVLLQLKNKTLAKSLNIESVNPFIQLEDSPFYIVQDTREWNALKDTYGRDIPRRAGVSSFGFGGANAHIVIEEYIPKERELSLNPVTPQNPAIVVLSAKNSDRLKEQAKHLLTAIVRSEFSNSDLADFAYTLQVGRDAMEERLAMIVGSVGDLQDKLQGFLEGNDDVADLFRGQIKRNKEALAVFTADEDLQKAIEAWINKEKYTKLLDLWVKGLNFDWNKLYGEIKPRRISLPTYPFARESYWVSEQKAQNANNSVREVSVPGKATENYTADGQPDALRCENQEKSELMTFEEVWQEQPLSIVSPGKIKTIICFLSEPKNQQVFSSSLRALDQQDNEHTQVVFITQGTTFHKQSSKVYTVSNTEKGSLQQAFRHIREDYGEIDALLYLWAIEDSNCIKDYSCIVNILQSVALEKLKVKRLLLAGEYNNSIDRCYLESWIGFERSLGVISQNTCIAAVYLETHGHSIATAVGNWFSVLWSELQSSQFESVLYRNGKRHVLKVRPLTVQPAASLLKPGGTYLITGGCGGLGNIFARHFAEKYTANLILTGRSPINEEISMKIKELENLGSRVLYLQSDVCDEIGMSEGVRLAKERFGDIHGVIHAAGITGSQSIIEKEIQDFYKVIDPKIMGTVVLDEVLKEEALEFTCYFSSSAAILGDFGACDYAVGNRFQMAYANFRCEKEHLRQRKGKSVVINWPLWMEGGMSVGEPGNSNMYLKSSGQRYLDTKDGINIFESIMSQNNNQYLVLVGEQCRVYRLLGLTQEEPSPTFTQAITLGKGRRVEMKGMNVEQCLEWDLKEQISKLLKISRDELDREENLADFGFDSINLAQFATILTSYYEIEITPTLFYGYSTIEKLTQYFLSKHSEVIQEFYKEEVTYHNVGEVERSETISQVAVNTEEAVEPSKRIDSVDSGFETESLYQNVPEPIAIIGMSGRFPAARNINEMWNILVSEQDVVTEIPKERFDWRKINGSLDKESEGHSPKWCGMIPGVSEFDPLFFEISPREAESIDPRQRLLLQESWKALEDAGYGPEQIKANRIGMFVGVEEGDYQLLTKGDGGITSNHTGVLASRLAYFLNLNGPVLAINTACSSGLVAAHQAFMSLQSGECDTAIAAGVNLMLTPERFMGISQAGMLSNDGKCFAFDKRANGMVPAEAVVAVVLKKLSKAKEDGDPIYAIIRGSGINYDGKTNGITAPSGVSQSELLKTVYDKYKINPEEIEYIVTHGTGTKLGDPIEINSLKDAFGSYTKKQGYCALTSTKTNFGHAFAASGLVSLVGLVQALRHETIPASLHCEEVNEYINWQESPFYVNRSSKTWTDGIDKRRIGAVSSFGMSGTNAHMVVESYLEEDNAIKSNQPPYYLLAFSAKSQESLQKKINEMRDVFKANNWRGSELSRISYTLLQGRQHYNYRCAVVIQDCENAVYILGQTESREKLPNLFKGKVPRDFKGQKAIEQYAVDLLKQSRNYEDDKNRYQEAIFAFADLYCQGYELPWGLLFGDIKLPRLNLPTYPFRTESYWVKNSDVNVNGIEIDSQAAKSTQSGAVVEQFVESFYEKVWVESDNFQGQLPDFCSSRLMVWVNDETLEVADLIGKKLCAEGLIKVRSGTEYKRCSDSEFYMDFSKEDHGRRLIKDIGLKSILCCLDFSDLVNENSSDIDGCAGKIVLLQELIKSIEKEQFYLFHFTKGLQNFKNVKIGLQGAVMAGLLRVLSSEYGKVVSRTIDLDLSTSNTESLASLVIGELCMEQRETEICYRAGRRYVPQLAEMELLQNQQQIGLKSLINPDKVTVITGGTRGIGAELAAYLVENGSLKLVLLGKEELPPRERWQSYLKDQDSDPISDKIRRIVDLENRGARVEVFSGLLSDVQRLSVFFDRIRFDMGEIGGVIHCAGTVDRKNSAFIDKEIRNFEEVLEPKVNGLMNLCRVLAQDKLDYFVLFSSVSAVIPRLAAGMTDYSTANCFMNYFSAYQNSLGNTYFKSINWPVWQDGGLGVVTPAYKQYGLAALSKDTGILLLENVFCLNNSNSIIMPVLHLKEKFSSEHLLWCRKPAKKKREEVLTFTLLTRLLSEELKIPMAEMDPEINFEEFGVDSIILTNLIPKAEALIGAKLDPTIFLENPTLKQLSSYLDQNLVKSIDVDSEQQLSGQLPEAAIDEHALNSIQSQAYESKNGVDEIDVVDEEASTHYLKYPPKITAEVSSESVLPSMSGKVAVIGMACHFPGAEDVDSYWNNLQGGKDCITEVPKSRWDIDQYYEPNHQKGKSISKWGGFIDGIELFDPKYFRLSEDEALFIDPLTRKLLEVTAQCFRDAGYNESELSGKNVGVFVGTRMANYTEKVLCSQNSLTGVGIGQNFIAAHVSQAFNLKGANLVVDTACSSSMTAIHLACQSLISKDSLLALAGGVDILIDEKPYLLLSEGKALSPDGKCHTFDESANGFVPGEGCGTVLLKTLEQAVKDGDRIYAVIDASAVNNDGRTMGITTPNPEAQREVIEAALRKGSVSPDTISYIETHGTGTMIGDPIELRALTKVFREFTQESQFCGVGSVKTNMGHLLSAAGIAGFIKIVLALRHGYIPPTLNCENPNPRFEFLTSPFYPVRTLKKWESRKGIRRAGISSFGFGGTNAHLIISEADANLPEGYLPCRNKLSPIVFERKRFWPDNKLESKQNHEVPERRNRVRLLEFFEETVI